MALFYHLIQSAMKNSYLLSWLIGFLSFTAFSQVTTTPTIPEADQPVTIFFNKAGTPLSTYNGTIYAHIGVTVDGQTWQKVIGGTWGNDPAQPSLTFVSGTTYSLNIPTNLYTYFNVPTTSSITQICVVFRTSNPVTAQTVDYFLNVGAFQATLNSPVWGSSNIINSGSSLAVSATNTNGNANYNLLANGVSIATQTGTSFSYNDTNITTNKQYDLQISQGNTTFSRKFSVIVIPTVITETIPANMVEGINYNPNDPTKATLVLEAPGKDFIYVAGSFNNWQPTSTYVMKKDATPQSTKFWLEINGLVPGAYNTYQYWVVKNSPIANSPKLVKTADPYSTLVLSPFDDAEIIAKGVYPGLPAFPAGQDREVTVLQTAQTPYNWQVTNFVKPKKEDLVIYEVLIRDFDANRSYQDLINRIDYFKNLKINAIELMPVMEYEGNESWGYNTAFHMALDKFYGPSTKLKELIDLCHQNGIAVILDLALNHAFGRNPMVRMWMNDGENDGWGDPATDNPYFNTVAKHSYSVGSDFNHSSQLTKNYVKRVIKHWIQEYKIDGYRWDLTKGFTQACSGGDDSCTNAYQADRVAILKDYADYSWSLDPTHYAIFEHLGSASEEQQWANYRINETPSKGVMMWGEMTHAYTQLIEGFPQNADISAMNFNNSAHGFTARRLIGYPESHDKERLMYSALAYGNGAGTNPATTLPNALTRMSSIGAMSLLFPGPKMIWHFAELGMDDSIFTCSNGSVNTDFDVVTGDCKLATKPQDQWTGNWLADAARAKVYNDWTKLITLKINEPVFEGLCEVSSDGNLLKPRLRITNTAVPSTELNSVVVIANFTVAQQSVNPNFPATGTWYNLMDNSVVNVSNMTTPIVVPSGQFRIYGNKPALLGIDDVETAKKISLYPNPAQNFFIVDAAVKKVQIFSITGQLVKNFNNQLTYDAQFDISDLHSGMYVVKVTDENSRESTMKLVKK